MAWWWGLKYPPVTLGISTRASNVAAYHRPLGSAKWASLWYVVQWNDPLQSVITGVSLWKLLQQQRGFINEVILVAALEVLEGPF